MEYGHWIVGHVTILKPQRGRTQPTASNHANTLFFGFIWVRMPQAKTGVMRRSELWRHRLAHMIPSYLQLPVFALLRHDVLLQLGLPSLLSGFFSYASQAFGRNYERECASTLHRNQDSFYAPSKSHGCAVNVLLLIDQPVPTGTQIISLEQIHWLPWREFGLPPWLGNLILHIRLLYPVKDFQPVG
jgi:hypothetical protein